MDEATVSDFLEKIHAERPLLEFDRLDHATARRLGEGVAHLAEQEQLPISVAVFLGEQRVFHAAFEGTTAANDDWIRRKRNTVLLNEVPSFETALRTRLSGRPPQWINPRRYAIASGAVPLRVRGSTVGVAALSGLVFADQADHELLMRGIRRARGSDAPRAK
jgi:uncharacterized protein (UPF0303 family)